MSERASAKRIRVNGDRGATLEYESTGTSVPVRLVDFSSSGAGLMLSEPPRVGAAVVLVLLEGEKTSRFSAVVRWAEPRGDGTWRAGCQFSQGIVCDFKFGSEAERRACGIDVRIRTQGDPTGQQTGVIVDYSHGGIGIRSEQAPTPGVSLLVSSSDGSVSFVARVQWCFSEGEEAFFGCQFARASDLRAFRKLMPESATPAPPEPEPVPRRSNRGTWLGCAFIYAWTALYACDCWPP